MASGPSSTANLLSPERLYGFPNTPNPYIAAVLFQTILYGVYLGLCCLCIFLLFSRRTSIGYIFLSSACLLFCLSTGNITYSYFLLFRHLLNGSLTFKQLYPMLIIYVACNTISDSILLYRCYVIWDRSLRVVIGPGLLLVVATGSGIVLEGINTQLYRWPIIYLIMAITFNILVTSLTAGRIWWKIRHMKASKTLETSKRSQHVFIFFVETGLIYPTYMCLDFVFRDQTNMNILMSAGLTPIVVIVPTLILVRVALHSPEVTSSPPVLVLPPANGPTIIQVDVQSRTQGPLPTSTPDLLPVAQLTLEESAVGVACPQPMYPHPVLESNNQISYEIWEGGRTRSSLNSDGSGLSSSDDLEYRDHTVYNR